MGTDVTTMDQAAIIPVGDAEVAGDLSRGRPKSSRS